MIQLTQSLSKVNPFTQLLMAVFDFKNRLIHLRKASIVIAVFFCITLTSYSQTKILPYSNSWTIVSGLTQPLFLGGVNVAVNYTTNRWVFEYSHGMFLEYKGQALKEGYRDNLISLKSPYSTGPGIGYRLFAGNIVAMDIRAEAKIHQYDVVLREGEDISYTNFDLGGGAYLQVRPFGNKSNGLKGIVIEPSIRYWGNVSSSLDRPFSYRNPDGVLVEHAPYPLNLFANISIGYTFIRK